MSQWVRLWEDMPNDPKWRVIARRSGRPVSEVIAVFVHMMTSAAASTTRGSLSSWSDEDVAIAIDANVEHVSAVREAMQGKTLDGARLTGWEKRQPKREDGAAERAKQWREDKRTQANAVERTDRKSERDEAEANATEPSEEKREDKKEDSCPKRVRTRHQYSSDFIEFWAAYPTDANMGKREAFDEWLKLGDEERRQAIASCPNFVRYCKANPTLRRIHACRYLAKHRFEGHADAEKTDALSDLRFDFGGGVSAPYATIRSLRSRGTWLGQWGPTPDEPNCRVPPETMEAIMRERMAT